MYGRLVIFGALLCCTLFASQIAASTYSGTFKILSSRVETVNKPAQTMRVAHMIETINTPTGATIPKHKALTVTYGKDSINAMARNAKKGSPVNLAVVAAVVAAGWAIDELTDQITREEMQPNPDPNLLEAEFDGYRWRVLQPSETYGGSPHGVVTNAGCNTSTGYSITVSSTRVDYKSIQCGSTTHSTIQATRVTCASCTYEPDLVPVAVPVPESEVADQVVPRVLDLPLHQLDDMLHDRFKRPLWLDELIDALRDWGQDVANRDPNLEWDDPPGRWVWTDPDTGDVTETDPLPAPNPNPGDETPPGTELEEEFIFCQWAPVVCNFFEWVKSDDPLPPIEQMPYENISASDYSVSWNSGLGSGTCPSSVTTELQGQTIGIDYENACWAASNVFKPILLIIASLLAVYILAGVRST